MLSILLLASNLIWYPATNWVDTVDTIADVHARQGGTIRFNGSQPPKSFNHYVDNNAYTKMTFDLMYENLISVDTDTLEFVPSLARRWAVSDDGQEFVFVIDERAHWSDGVPVTAEDVKWTFDTLLDKKNDTGSWKLILGEFNSPEVLDRLTVRFVKKGGSPKNWRDILNCGMFNILPKHAFEGKNFNSLDLLNAPVGGPYQLTRVAEQVETEFSRVKNWWRKDFPSCKNTCNFDRIVMRYYIDNENAFEAFKKRMIDVYPVYTARIFANETHGEKFDRNWIVKRVVRNHRPVGFQGFAMNMRKWPFDDLKVRQAMCHLIDRETMNRTMMGNAYFLLKSYFTELYDEEHPCTNAFYDYSVEKAKALLAEAGWVIDPKTKLLTKDGRPFKFTFLSRSGGEDKFLALFNHALEQCGIAMTINRKDFAGWMRDMDTYNYEMTWASFMGSIFKTPETMWHSAEADRKGSNNITGFKSAAVDALIAAEKEMDTTEARNEAYRQMDALISEQCPFAFLWQSDTRNMLYWNKFGMPKPIFSKYSDEDCVFGYWWYDEDKARELDEAMADHACLPDLPLAVDFDTETAK